MKNREEFKRFWDKLEKTPIDIDDRIEKPVGIFPKGTSRYKIWLWVEYTFDCCLGELPLER